MRENYEKYAELLLKKGLNIKKNQPLLVYTPVECIDFIRVLSEVAYKIGVKDIHYCFSDIYLNYYALKNLSNDELENSDLFKLNIFNEYAEKEAAFLTLVGNDPEVMRDIDPKKVGLTSKIKNKSRLFFKEKQLACDLAWTIAPVATLGWSKKLYPKAKDPLEKTWNKIFELTLVNEENPIKAWDEKIKINEKRINKLNSLKIKKLTFKNSLGTNLDIYLNEYALWQGTVTTTNYGKDTIANIPAEEVFCAPIKNKTEGRVYSTKPLVYNGNLIEDFYIDFEKGKAIKWKAKKGDKILEEIINTDSGSNMLGEVALVNYDSSISKSNMIFYETLIDENASCHIALGEGYSNCIKNGQNMSKEELNKHGLNKSLMHVDFMIGSKDLTIEAETYTGEYVTIFKNGNFDFEF